MPACPDCGALVADASATCPACGASIQTTTRNCPNCEETIAADATACPACGHLHAPTACDEHPDRQAAGRCVICGRAVCEDDDHGQGAVYACERHADIPVIEGWAQVYTTGSEIEAQLIRGNLDAEGIEARVFSQKDHAFNVGIGDLSPVRILVPAYAWTEALEAIRAHMDESGEVEFACQECGEPYDAGQTTCDACGAALAPSGASG